MIFRPVLRLWQTGMVGKTVCLKHGGRLTRCAPCQGAACSVHRRQVEMCSKCVPAGAHTARPLSVAKKCGLHKHSVKVCPECAKQRRLTYPTTRMPALHSRSASDDQLCSTHQRLVQKLCQACRTRAKLVALRRHRGVSMCDAHAAECSECKDCKYTLASSTSLVAMDTPASSGSPPAVADATH